MPHAPRFDSAPLSAAVLRARRGHLIAEASCQRAACSRAERAPLPLIGNLAATTNLFALLGDWLALPAISACTAAEAPAAQIAQAVHSPYHLRAERTRAPQCRCWGRWPAPRRSEELASGRTSRYQGSFPPSSYLSSVLLLYGGLCGGIGQDILYDRGKLPRRAPLSTSRRRARTRPSTLSRRCSCARGDTRAPACASLRQPAPACASNPQQPPARASMRQHAPARAISSAISRAISRAITHHHAPDTEGECAQNDGMATVRAVYGDDLEGNV